MQGTVEDEQLLARIAHEDEDALRSLYHRHAARLYAVACRLLGSREEAEEIIQESFLEVWRRASMFEAGVGSATGWILAIARNRAIDRLRARATRQRTLSVVQREEPLPARTPEHVVEVREARVLVTQALDGLSPEQRMVIEMAYFDGLSQTEIASRTGSPLGTVKGRTRSALEKLAERLGKGPA